MAVSKAAQQATRRYEAKNNDVIRLLLPRGTKDRIRATGASVNGFINRAVLQELEALEAVQRSTDNDAPGD